MSKLKTILFIYCEHFSIVFSSMEEFSSIGWYQTDSPPLVDSLSCFFFPFFFFLQMIIHMKYLVWYLPSPYIYFTFIFSVSMIISFLLIPFFIFVFVLIFSSFQMSIWISSLLQFFYYLYHVFFQIPGNVFYPLRNQFNFTF